MTGLTNFFHISFKTIFKKIDTELAEKAEQFPTLAGKFAGLRKYRIGDYRVIDSNIDNSVVVLQIAHRKEAYR